MRHPVIFLALVGALALSGCDTKAITQAADTLTSATQSGDKVKVMGKVFASADQVAVIASGALNWSVLARSDEKGVKGAKVELSQLGSLLPGGATAQTDDTGEFTVKVAENTSYVVHASFTSKDGQAVTLTGLVKVEDANTTFELDVAHNLVASKLVSAGVSEIDSAKLDEAVSQMDSDLSTVSKAPTPTSEAEAAAKFDELAGSELKAMVEAMTQ